MTNPKYFVMDTLSIGVGHHAYTTNTEPCASFKAQVNLKGLGPITLCHLKPSQPPHHYQTSLPHKDIPVYKSNLQKCVRRRLTDNAIRTAYALLSVDENQLLRRLPIIMMEDVLPHRSIVEIVWWMMAVSKGYQLSDSEVEYILGVIYLLGEIDQYQVKNHSSQKGETKEREVPFYGKDILWAMRFRKCYGGMKCDGQLIDHLLDTWKGMGKEWELLTSEVSPVDLTSIGVCDKEDVILEAIDQHPYPWIIGKIVQKFPHYTEYQIRGAIWYYRSRINTRKVCSWSVPVEHNDVLREIYEMIEVDVHNLSVWIHEKVILGSPKC